MLGLDRSATEAHVRKYGSYLSRAVGILANELWNAAEHVGPNRIYFSLVNERIVEDGSLMPCHARELQSIDVSRAWPGDFSTFFRGMKAGSATGDELKQSRGLSMKSRMTNKL